MKKDLHLKMEKLIVNYPDGTSLELMSSVGGKLNVEVSKDKHPAWGNVTVLQTSNELTDEYNKWF